MALYISKKKRIKNKLEELIKLLPDTCLVELNENDNTLKINFADLSNNIYDYEYKVNLPTEEFITMIIKNLKNKLDK